MTCDKRHVEAIFVASLVAKKIAEILPETDLVENLLNILEVQASICQYICQNKHFGDDNLEDFEEFLDNLEEQISHLISNKG